MRPFLFALFVASVGGHFQFAHAQKTYIIDYSTTSVDGSVTLRGPSTVTVTNLNRLRYGLKIGGKETIAKPPAVDLSSLGMSSAPSTKSGTAATPTTVAATTPPAAPETLRPSQLAPQGKKTTQPIPPAVVVFNGKVQAFQNSLNADALKKSIDDLLSGLAAVKKEIIDGVESANAATSVMNLGAADLSSLLQSSDADLLSTHHRVFDREVARRLQPGPFQSAVAQDWPIKDSTIIEWKGRLAASTANLAHIQRQIDLATKEMAALQLSAPPVQETWGTDATALYSTAVSNLTAAASSLAGWTSDLSPVSADISAMNKSADSVSAGSTNGTAFATLHSGLVDWNTRLTNLKVELDAHDSDKPDIPGPLAISYVVSCKPMTAGTKTTVLSLTTTQDNYVALDPSTTSKKPATGTNAQAKTTAAPQTLVTVTCDTPIVIAAGVAFSSIPDREFSIQQVGTTTNSAGMSTPINVFSVTADSSFHPVPLAAVHVRFADWNNVSMYGTIGIAANIKGQNSGGSAAEYLVGPTVGAFRYVYLTTGLYIGRESILGGGFKVGGPVPAGTTTPPLQTSYKPGFGVAITFSK